jgi:FKBP-type peptidyl-prolyl cis-trans isomerase
MAVGERSRFTIAPDKAYGPMGRGDGMIPPEAWLVFDIELLAIETVANKAS